MVSSLEKLNELLDKHNLTHADLEFILNFMETENISPQLAMRRIKAFETLKEKLENNKEKEKTVMLEDELRQVKNQLLETRSELQELQEQKIGLESEKEELESKSELLDSEREELQHQLELIKDMQFEDETDDELVPIDQLEDLQNNLQKVGDEENFRIFISPIIEALNKIQNGEEIEFDTDQYKNEINDFITEQIEKKSPQSPLSRSPDTSPEQRDKNVTSTTDSQIVKPSDIMKKEKEQKERKPDKSDPKKEKAEVEQGEKSKPKDKTKPEKPEKKVSDKEEQVLNLFLEFVNEADTDKSFRDRVSTICDMDEAYEYLGSIGLSQVYSFSSRGIDKKEELIQLLNSWKKEGIPR